MHNLKPTASGDAPKVGQAEAIDLIWVRSRVDGPVRLLQGFQRSKRQLFFLFKA